MIGKNIELDTTDGECVLINWDNVTSVTKPENYLLGQIGDAGGYRQVNFTNKESIYTKSTIEEIKNKLINRSSSEFTKQLKKGK